MSACLVDSNVWLAAVVGVHLHHDPATGWLSEMDRPAHLVFCRATQQSLLRLLTNAAVHAPYGLRPLTNGRAWEVVDALMADDRVVLRADEPAGVDAAWRSFSARRTASPKLWMDAYLAAFALAGGYQMVTTDAAFGQFSGLDLRVLG